MIKTLVYMAMYVCLLVATVLTLAAAVNCYCPMWVPGVTCIGAAVVTRQIDKTS